MRDVNRIKPTCDKLAEYWSKQPDMRLGQFMSVILGEIYAISGNRDPFFMEDDEFFKYLSEVEWLE